MNCKTCNFSLTEEQLVCPVCGTEVVTDKPLEMEAPQTEPVMEPTPQVELTPPEPVMEPTPQVELTPAEPVMNQALQMEQPATEPVMNPTPEVATMPNMESAPLPTNNLSLEQNESGADFGTVKPQKKGLGIVLKILITLLVVLGAAAVGYFGFKYFFNTPQEANFQGYKYRISGAYSAVIQSNEKLLVDESKDSSKSKWKIVIETSDMPAGSFNELKEKQDEIKANIEGENIVNSVETKKVNNLDMLVFDINTSAKKAAYIVYLLNNGNSALKANIEFKEAKIPKTLEDLAEIINTAKKS